MLIYNYELPTTGAISFSEICTDNTSNHAHTIHLSDATQQRANLRAALKAHKRADETDDDYLKQVKILEDYLPQLYGIISCVSQDELSFKSEPAFSWRTTLSSTLLNNSPRLELPTLHVELSFSLLTYGFLLSNHARSILNTLGTYERDKYISDADRTSKDATLNFAVTLLCRASGVFSHLAESVLPLLRIPTRPPDLSREVVLALSKMALADAQSLAIRKLRTKAAAESALRPGPPLPASHPSPALIAKLYLECAELYAAARALVLTSGASEVTADLRTRLSDAYAWHTALAHEWLGVDAGEHGSSARGGEAVGFLTWARKELTSLRNAHGRLDPMKKGKGKANRIANELAAVEEFLKHYKKLDDSLHFQPVPTQAELQARIPAGRMAVAIKPFTPPPPAFGPGSTEYSRRQTQPSQLTGLSPSKGIQEEDDVLSSKDADYAGAGSYF
ncbi:hypothetical protein FISHEDRAFT_77469 [Fistulina hepatica ATCC 64428]|uniref:pH-response regulator protein palC n=1 Tax=Fistulina hepatica ATCC 64428 TaxID=1128425 RepID=A0A0D7A0I3_9AGAR|nr:hypothetical protein FISHEDRAFT_77469 [Fistulina hepatica ATCC 64428]